MIGGLAADFIWMDGSDKDVEDNFKWWDGESFNNGYTNWAQHEPNGGQNYNPPEYCMALAMNNDYGHMVYKWLDIHCDIADKIIYNLCQKDITVIHT